MSVQIIVDSTVDMPERMKDRFRIVPLTVDSGAEEFIDGVTIDKHRFYERLVESDELPTTSQASPAAFDAIFSDVASVGDSAVVVTLASKFSGTYQSACIAAAEYEQHLTLWTARARLSARETCSCPRLPVCLFLLIAK